MKSSVKWLAMMFLLAWGVAVPFAHTRLARAAAPTAAVKPAETPEASETPEVSRTPEASETPLVGETPEAR